jgi:hypothetical protein
MVANVGDKYRKRNPPGFGIVFKENTDLLAKFMQPASGKKV